MSKSQRESKTPTTPSSSSSSFSSSSSSTTSSSTPKSKPSEPFDPPRKSEKRSRRKPLPKAASSSVPSICSHHRTQQPPPASPLSNKISQYEHLDDAAACDMDAAKSSPPAKPAELQVPRILTENPALDKLPAEHNARASSPPAAAGLHRLRLRAHTPRLAGYCRRTGASPVNTAGAVRHGKQQQKGGRLSDSLAVVKTSSDPHRDFRDSMMEMIVEEEMQTSDELEDLLACYLSLNSKDHHDVIVEVFKQIWVDLSKKLEL